MNIDLDSGVNRALISVGALGASMAGTSWERRSCHDVVWTPASARARSSVLLPLPSIPIRTMKCPRSGGRFIVHTFSLPCEHSCKARLRTPCAVKDALQSRVLRRPAG